MEEKAEKAYLDKKAADEAFQKNHTAKIEAAVKEIAAMPSPVLPPYPVPRYPESYNPNATNASNATNATNGTNATNASAVAVVQ